MKKKVYIESNDIKVFKENNDFELKIHDDFSFVFSHEVLVKFSQHLKDLDKDLILKNPSSDMKIFEEDLLLRLKEKFLLLKDGKSDAFKAGINKCIEQLN
jgi:hypothetical protein